MIIVFSVDLGGREVPTRCLEFRFSSPERRRVAAANRGRLFFGYFLLATQKKVTSCRSTTGEVVFGYSYFDKHNGRIAIRPYDATRSTNPFKYAPSGKLSSTG